jgi:site-specific recombinase XerD
MDLVNELKSFTVLVRNYRYEMRARRYHRETIALYEEYLDRFVAWCAEQGVTQPCQVRRSLLERYLLSLYRRCPDDLVGVCCRLMPVGEFFAMLASHNLTVNRVVEYEPQAVTEDLAVAGRTESPGDGS